MFLPNKNLYRENYENIINKSILIIGLGGVGSWCFESLIRFGFSDISIVDLDDVCISNINRQIQATHSNIGKFKVDLLKDRAVDINPDCKIKTFHMYFNKKNINTIFNLSYDIVIDAIDDIKNKCLLISHCYHHKIDLITVGGTGGKKDPSQVMINDLNKSFDDPLLALVRKTLRQKHDFPRGRPPYNITCVFSPETTSVKHKGSFACNSEMGSAAYLTATFGMFVTYSCINKLINQVNENNEIS